MKTLEEQLRRIKEDQEKFEEDFNRVLNAQDGSYAIPHPAFFVGGKYHGMYMTHRELVSHGNGKFSPRWSATKYHNENLINLDLEDQPLIDGYLGPMWDGGYLRYETQEVYDSLFD